MRKAKNLIGLKAISQHEGKELGKVHDLLFSQDSSQLLGLLMDERGLFGFSDATAIPFAQVREIGTHAVMVPNGEAKIKVHSMPAIAEAYDNELTLTSKQLTTDKAKRWAKFPICIWTIWATSSATKFRAACSPMLLAASVIWTRPAM